MMEGKKILLGVTGSIAAYKAILLTRLLIKAGAEVKVITTPAARDFVSGLTLSTLSKNPVVSDLFDEQSWSNHVMLGRWADVMVIAPLSCNTLAKMANGLCDNLLMATWLSATCPVLLAPAMDDDMWHHPATIHNLNRVKSFGNSVIPVSRGELASGLYGDGRMAEPDHIFNFLIENYLSAKPLVGKKVLVTAGPTYEAIDPVRFIGNHSSGKMGVALAREFHRRGAEVHLVLGPVSEEFSLGGISVVRVITADEMYQACTKIFDKMDVVVMAAAVADFKPLTKVDQKIKKKENLLVELTATPDILRTLGERKGPNQLLIGFALETTNESDHARQKLQTKNADMIVMNSLNEPGAGFGLDTNRVTIFEKSGVETTFETKSKDEVAKDIVDAVIKICL